MIETFALSPGVTLRCCRDDRFKHGLLSLHLVRPMCREEASLNALLGSVLLRGSQKTPDLRAITQRLDELWGGSVWPVTRRAGDWQTTGLACGFLDDRFAPEPVLDPTLDFFRELLLAPAQEGEHLRRDYVESEKRNLIQAIEDQRNDKMAWACSQLFRHMAKNDPLGAPRLGTRETVEAITPESLTDHYRAILQTSRIELFYAGSRDSGEMAALCRELTGGLARQSRPLPPQTGLSHPVSGRWEQTMDISQGKLALGYVTADTTRSGRDFAAAQMLNLVFGAGMTSKLFVNVREKKRLCYEVGSGYSGTKGVLTVTAGMDWSQAEAVREEVAAQLEACRRGDITPAEMEAAREAALAGLRTVTDSPESMESYYLNAALSGLDWTPEEYADAIRGVTEEEVSQAACRLTLTGEFFLRGEQP